MMLFKYWDRKILLFLCLSYSTFVTAGTSIGIPITLSPEQLKYYEQNNFKILGVIQLKSNTEPDYQLMEFSGIAWDNDQQELILLSDRGFIIHTKPTFNKGQLIDLKFTSHHYLKNSKGNKFKDKANDSEGLALKKSKNNRYNDTELIISFERKPRVIHFTTNGDFIFKESINNKLNDINNYESENKALEAITLHEQFNIITGPERPLDGNSDSLTLHNLNDKEWSFKPSNKNYGSLVGLTTLPNNQIIALERIFSNVFAGISNVIHLITLKADSLKQETLLKLQPGEGYFNENFEGISWHKENRFFMISDDNDNFFQRTLLIYFEIPSLKKE